MTGTALIFSGSGTGIPAQCGAYQALLEGGYVDDVTAIGGTSGGGLLAMAIAARMSPATIRDDLCRFLTRKDLLDFSLRPWDRFGIFKGDRIHGFLREFYGDLELRQLRIRTRVTACDLSGGTLTYFDSAKDDVYVHDVARATMAIPLFFKAHYLRTTRTKRLLGPYVDGGTTANFAIGMFDDLEPTRVVGIRFRPGKSTYDPKSLKDYAAALFDLRQDAADAGGSRYPTTIYDIRSAGSRLEFGLSEAELRVRFLEGFSAVRT